MKFLYALVGTATAVAVHLAEGGDVELGFDEGGCGVSLATAVRIVREGMEDWERTM